MDEDFSEILGRIEKRFGGEPFDLAVVLGSGLGSVAELAENPAFFPYGDFPFFPANMIAGHAGQLIAGYMSGWRVLFFQGRFHCYQGYNARQVATPVRLAHALGCRRLLLTNAAGGLSPELSTGDILFIQDHINLLGDNPLRGEVRDPFIDLSRIYAVHFFQPLQLFASSRGIRLSEGILAAVPGPSYETPAEVRALRMFGADAVSMSTIPEAIMAKYLQMELVGLSFIANQAAGIGKEALTHSDVLQAGCGGIKDLGLLFSELVRLWQSSS